MAPAEVVGFDSTNAYQRTVFSWIWPILQHGYKGDLAQEHVSQMLGSRDHAKQLWEEVESVCAPFSHNPPPNAPTRWLRGALMKLHRRTMIKHAIWGVFESVVRVGGPLLLREFLKVLEQAENAEGDHGGPKTSTIWMFAVLLGNSGWLYTLSHHQTFWIGMRFGFHMRTQMMAAVHAKVLRLNSKAISSITTGLVVNLVSNDVRRFEDAGCFWIFLFAGPLECLAVVIVLWEDIGWLPTLASMSALLMLIPLQSYLSTYVGKIRRETAALTDRRVHVVSEVVSGITACKMYAWEDSFMRIIRQLRQLEVTSISRINMLRAFNATMFFASHAIVSYIAFSIYQYQGGELTMPRISYVLAMLHLPKLSLANFFVRAVETVTEANVSIQRIERFLNLPEPSDLPAAESETARVVFRGGTFEWDADAAAVDDDSPNPDPNPSRAEGGSGGGGFQLKLGHFSVEEGELIGICGPVGSGKSSLLAALLAEITPTGGSNTLPLVRGSMAYCAQQPWIIAGTLRDNILFGLAYDPVRYHKTLEGCALVEDIGALPAGDMTELGERGINLSGGQKARLALARAAYSTAEVVLMDDPLSAVDPAVGQHLFRRCIAGPLMAGRTRLLVTHQTQFLPRCRRVLTLLPNCEPIWADGTAFEGKDASDDELGEAKSKRPSTDTAPKRPSLEEALRDIQAATDNNINPMYQPPATLPKIVSESNLTATEDKDTDTPAKQKGFSADASAAGASMVLTEDKARGGVGWAVYREFSWYAGHIFTVLVAVLVLGGNGLQLTQEVWVATWAQSDSQTKPTWVHTYTWLTAAVLLVGLSRAVLCFHCCLEAAKRMHGVMTARVLRAPLDFFHANPTGRVLNRFSKDLGVADEQLPNILFDTLQCGGEVLGTVIISAVAVPLVTPILVPLYFMFSFVRTFYVATSREIKREEALSRSPLFTSFSSTLKGLATIRAYKCQERYQSAFLRKQDENGSWWFCFIGTARWFGFRLDMLSALFLLAAAVVVVPLRQYVSVSLVGISLAHVLQLSGLLQWFMRQTAEVENNMTSVERLLEYTKLPQEPPRVADGGGEPPVGWPSCGRLVFDDVYATYRPALPPVLKGLSFEVAPGQMCGIAGRTGSGKSSLLLTLYRMIHLERGAVTLDGVDVATVGLDALRQSLAIIPQDPVLFSGSFRHNLDPFGAHNDDELWRVLTAVQLKAAVQELGGGGSGLDAVMAECGDNLSVGQKQLVCLARAMLRRAKVFALDEATANVDNATDALIQQALRTSLQAHPEDGTSALIIAHRLDTIVDCNTILVLSDGVAIEFGSPAELGKNPKGVFGALLRSAQLHGGSTSKLASEIASS